MAPSNPEIILRKLNEHLQFAVELTLIGRAALNLGFDPPIAGPPETLTFDIDVVVPLDQEKALDNNEMFWTAIEATNDALVGTQLYISHIFLENQLILGAEWQQRRSRILLPDADKLNLFRPAAIDLLLSKMARADDPDDQADILAIIRRESLTEETVEKAFTTARYPDEPDLILQFEKAKQFIRAHYRSQQKPS
jgi:hypothetical protein